MTWRQTRGRDYSLVNINRHGELYRNLPMNDNGAWAKKKSNASNLHK